MLGIPAKIAGCPVKILATPPRKDSTIDPHILAAADLIGIKDIYKMGGAQAIAAMAYGTRTVPKTDKIFGPGNPWVTEAKIQVSSDAGGAACEFPAGPSEVLVIADAGADPDFVASDLLAQAEHGPSSQVVLVSSSAPLISAVKSAISRQIQVLPRAPIIRSALSKSLMIRVRDLAEAFRVSNRYAPEHLILHTPRPRTWMPKIMHAGSVFLGAWSPEAAGDYASGPNHVLPTYGFARAYGGVTVDSFMKSMTVQRLSRDGLRSLGPVVERLAALEYLQGHKNSISIRLCKINGGGGR
jgi:histidinol dehydrogenase